LGNMGSINAHCSSDSSSRFAIYEKYMTFLQSTSHFFIFEIGSRYFIKIWNTCEKITNQYENSYKYLMKKQ